MCSSAFISVFCCPLVHKIEIFAYRRRNMMSFKYERTGAFCTRTVSQTTVEVYKCYCNWPLYNWPLLCHKLRSFSTVCLSHILLYTHIQSQAHHSSQNLQVDTTPLMKRNLKRRKERWWTPHISMHLDVNLTWTNRTKVNSVIYQNQKWVRVVRDRHSLTSVSEEQGRGGIIIFHVNVVQKST